MKLALIDWLIVIGYCVLALSVGVCFARRAGRSVRDFFTAGGSLPWWIAGTSMVATTFAIDTPLSVAGMTRSKGIAENWYWWPMVFGTMLVAVFYARLWRRANILTDIDILHRSLQS